MAGTASASFVMHGARAAIASGLVHIEEHVNGIEQAVVENPGLAFDLAKTLVESACRTILTERAVAFNENDDLPKIFRMVTSILSFLPPEASEAAEVRRSLAQTLGGLHTAVLGICELRNSCGFASHGSGNPRLSMEPVQALLAAEAADTIVGFLSRIHRQDRTALPVPPLSYEDNAAFNNYVDQLNDPVKVFDEEFRPSLVLFEMAPEPYRVYLAEFASETSDTKEEVGPGGPGEGTP